MKGEPATQDYGDSFNVRITGRYKDGKRNDGAKGEPAKQIVDVASGLLYSIEHYKNGELNDGMNGEPAIQELYANGKPARIEHIKNGVRNDGAKGELSVQKFDGDGNLIRAEHWKNGNYDGSDLEEIKKKQMVNRLTAKMPGIAH